MDTLITSSGVIKNRNIPRVGIISQNSLNHDFIEEIMVNGIDIGYESYFTDMRLDLKRQGKTEEEIDQELNEIADNYSCEETTFIFGDWIKVNGKYEIDKNGKNGFALTLSTGGIGNICIEYSKLTKWCNNTSPCYVMADDSGPCGDLDTQGDAVLAYCLPDNCLAGDRD